MHIISQWIPRSQNQRADFLSRCNDPDDWGVQWWVFKYLDTIWGPHTFDRFASTYNRKCDKFNIKFWCREASGTDAFKHTWVGENNWLVPPPSVVTSVIKKND